MSSSLNPVILATLGQERVLAHQGVYFKSGFLYQGLRPPRKPGVLVLTDRQLHWVTVRGFRKQQVDWHQGFALSDISGISSETDTSSQLPMLTLWIGGSEYSFNALKPAAFIDAVNRSVTSVKTSSPSEELERLSELFSAGVLSAEEWQRAKEIYLGKPPDEKQTAIDRLRQLHDLFRAGVLSESEFNLKKWDILSRR